MSVKGEGGDTPLMSVKGEGGDEGRHTVDECEGRRRVENQRWTIWLATLPCRETTRSSAESDTVNAGFSLERLSQFLEEGTDPWPARMVIRLIQCDSLMHT